MIWYYLILFIGNLLNAVIGALHIPIITQLPFGMDGYLSDAVSYFNFIRYNVPPINVIFVCTMTYLSFKTLIFALKQFRLYKD